MTITKSLQIINTGEGVERREPSYSVGGIVKWCSHYGKQYGSSWKKLKIQLPHDSAIPILGIYPEKMKTLIWKNICTPVFIAELFTLVKIWKQPKCPQTDEWIEKMWHAYIYIYIYIYIYKMKYHSAIEKNEIM